MKNNLSITTAAACLIMASCGPNLVVSDAQIDFTAQTVSVAVTNTGNEAAGNHLTYIEVNEVSAPAGSKPQSQYSANVPGIAVGATWNSGPIPFSDFSQPRGLDLTTLTNANIVVSADAKNMVEETNETDNISSTNH